MRKREQSRENERYGAKITKFAKNFQLHLKGKFTNI